MMNHFRKYFPAIASESGVTIIFVIIAMVVLAVLGVGLYTLTSTSALNQAEAQKAVKAYYLAESGIRVAAGEYANASAANRNAVVLNLHGKKFTMINNAGTFTLELYPYWFYADTFQSASSTSIILHLPSEKVPLVNGEGSPEIKIFGDGILKLANNTLVGVFTAASIAAYDPPHGRPVTFSIPDGFPYDISAGNELYIGYVYALPEQAISLGGDLVITDKVNTAGMYPPENGFINITQTDGINLYTYESRIPQTIDYANLPASFTLHNIQPASVDHSRFPIIIKYNGTSPVTIYDATLSTQIYLTKTLSIQSRATYGN